MAAMNSSVLACNYVISGASESSKKLLSMPASASMTVSHQRVVRSVRAQGCESEERSEGRRAALLGLAGVLFTSAVTASSANAGVFDEYLEKSKANKELNDKKRLATSGANFARAFTVEFGTCKFPYNFTGCQDLAKQKKVPFISDDLEIECEGKEKYKCGSNVFWKW
ncbi:photosystem I reaction center subunit N, chloroplastic [Asparagus officinalis]|uniref:photosystem I reaction center subunit N, chloroplastic n=1 Tax=Asparagus officinalis TaxID=4686 RepID=UPI00098E3D20|nr:photosystem I reaction center subunit N, chloroplastic [Asparagus officinalis]